MSKTICKRLRLRRRVTGGFELLEYFGVQMPTFIDGRMAIWTRDGFTPVTEYKRVYLLGDAKKFNDYHFDWLIVGNDFLLSDKVKSSTDFGEWTLIYSDDKAQYLVRK